MKLRVLAFAWLVVVAAADSGLAQSAQDMPRDERIPTDIPTVVSPDERIHKIVQEKTGAGVAIAAMIRPGCESIDIVIGRVVDGKWQTKSVEVFYKLFVKATGYGGMTSVPAGEYTVIGLVCKSGKNRTNLNGPFATFQVNAGEVVNVGVLNLNYELEGFFNPKSGKMKKAIEPMQQDVLTDLKQKFPLVFPKAIERRMVLIGPTDVEIKRR